MRGVAVTALTLLGVMVVAHLDPGGMAGLLRAKGYDLLQASEPRPVGGAGADHPVLVSFSDRRTRANWLELSVLIRRLTASGVKAVVLPEVLDWPDPISPEQVAAAWMDGGLGLDLRDSLSGLRGHDQILGEALKGRPVIAALDSSAPGRLLPESGVPRVRADPKFSANLFVALSARANLEPVDQAAAAVGDVSLMPDADGAVRSIPLATRMGGAAVGSILLQVLNVTRGSGEFRITADRTFEFPIDLPGIRHGMVFSSAKGGYRLPADARGRYRLYLARLEDLPRLDAAEVISGQVRSERLKGRIAVIDGVPATAPKFDMGNGERWSRGEIMVNALDQVMRGQHVVRPAWAHAVELIMLAGLGIVLLILAALPGSAALALFAAGSAAGLFGGSLYLLDEMGLWVDPVIPGLGIVLAAVVALTLRPLPKTVRAPAAGPGSHAAPLSVSLAPATARRRSAKSAIENFVGTVMVCGARDLAELERQYAGDPETLLSILSQFQGMVAEHIESQGGTVVPSASDALPGIVAAFWSHRDERSDTARRACDCALRLLAGLDEFNAKLSVGKEPHLDPPPPLNVSVGIESGRMLLHRPGDAPALRQRLMGPAVAGARRLHDAASSYGPASLVGGAAAESVRDRYALLEIDRLAPRPGETEPLTVYALMGNPLVRANPRFRTLDDAHKAIFEALRERNWPTARALLMQCRKISTAVPELYDIYEKRIDYFEHNPPGEGWTGAFEPPVR